jgi:hypothetical protein
MAETFARGDKLVDRGTPLIDASRDLCPGNVGGHIVGFPFFLVIDATSAAGTQMKYNGTTGAYAIPYKAGSVVGISACASTALGTQACTFTVYNGTTTTGFACNLVTSGQVTSASQNKDLDTFAAGDKINVLCEHTSATTDSMSVTVFVEM